MSYFDKDNHKIRSAQGLYTKRNKRTHTRVYFLSIIPPFTFFYLILQITMKI